MSTLEALRKKWAILIINTIGYHERMRFHELMEVLIDISPKALSDTLKELEAEGLIKRESFAEIPPRVEYILTNDGSELRDIMIIPLLKWVAARKNKSVESHLICQRMPVPLWMYPMAKT
ncbi:MAG TPA: helix-turn-helix domain-containing protein [Methanothrix sp.]|nr:helix-turn-helix domain-containing protein [Methanothrix sp.]